jgi:uncharacterized protein involved in exopolysaccharide biosynthesis
MHAQPPADPTIQKALPQIHISDVIAFFRKYMLVMVAVTTAFGIAGFLLSYTVTKTFTAKTVLLPEYSTGKPSFFSMALGGGSQEGTGTLVPELYPNILESTAFGEHLLKQPVTSNNGQLYKSLKDYLLQSSSPGLLSRFKSIFSSSNSDSKVTPNKIQLNNPEIANYSSDEESLIKAAKGMVKASIEQKNGLIAIESELDDPVVAAVLVESSKDYLINYVEDFRVAKLEQQLKFISSRVLEARKRQQNAEYALQSYRDHNRNSFLNVARIEEQRLQSDFTLAQSIYSDLILKEEQAKIKVKEERPVFKVLEPTQIPLNKTGPKRLIIAGISAVAGFIFAMIYALFVREKVQQYFV